jgi:hypothetical protein
MGHNTSYTLLPTSPPAKNGLFLMFSLAWIAPVWPRTMHTSVYTKFMARGDGTLYRRGRMYYYSHWVNGHQVRDLHGQAQTFRRADVA